MSFTNGSKLRIIISFVGVISQVVDCMKTRNFIEIVTKQTHFFPAGVNNHLQRLYGKTFVNVQLAISAITHCANIASNAFITEETL